MVDKSFDRIFSVGLCSNQDKGGPYGNTDDHSEQRLWAASHVVATEWPPEHRANRTPPEAVGDTRIPITATWRREEPRRAVDFP